jgi:hypothetical protein
MQRRRPGPPFAYSWPTEIGSDKPHLHLLPADEGRWWESVRIITATEHRVPVSTSTNDC